MSISASTHSASHAERPSSEAGNKRRAVAAAAAQQQHQRMPKEQVIINFTIVNLFSYHIVYQDSSSSPAVVRPNDRRRKEGKSCSLLITQRKLVRQQLSLRPSRHAVPEVLFPGPLWLQVQDWNHRPHGIGSELQRVIQQAGDAGQLKTILVLPWMMFVSKLSSYQTESASKGWMYKKVPSSQSIPASAQVKKMPINFQRADVFYTFGDFVPAEDSEQD